MINVLDKSCRENQNTHFIFNNFFLIISPFMRQCQKMRWRSKATNDITIWHIRVVCWISKATCTYAHAHTHAPGYPHACTHAHACAHRPVSNTYCCFKTKIFANAPQYYVICTLHLLLMVFNIRILTIQYHVYNKISHYYFSSLISTYLKMAKKGQNMLEDYHDCTLLYLIIMQLLE